ncbi:hypothetical protein P43SY_008315 [Pythium insidiosum]|uniref:Condensin complex subunit 1 C-terminal domain-containing protein n=1 Tax=Pythium insidiosum TaxID=114742 RepID=A0AAD5Q4D1_PYTIN|nr:hypothetical protein P43SY_008315 [Pythium insidiosum]
MATALEKDLVRTLQALSLQDLPEASIKAVFDTGGTALRRLQEDDVDVSLDQLVALDRVFLKYLKQFLAHVSDDDDAMAASTDGSPLWGFLAAEEVNTSIMGEEAERAHPFAAYRALFTLLHSMIAIGEGYAQLGAEEKIHALMKAVIAAKVYLTWLQLPGGAAYGLFMPFVYRQVLDVAKKWVDLAVSPVSFSVTPASQRDQTPRKKASMRKGQAGRRGEDDQESYAGLQRRLDKFGAELIDSFASFLRFFPLSSSRESIVPTVEMVEAIAIEMRSGVKFHKLAVEIIGTVLVQKQLITIGEISLLEFIKDDDKAHVYISTIALSFMDSSPLIRRNALLLFSQLLLQDYIKWRESLLRFFLRAVVDEDEELSGLARHTLCGPLLQKSPHLFTNKFIEMIFVFNRYEGKVNLSEPFEREGIEEISLPGSNQYPKRSQLYKFLLQNMTDEQKLQISMKLCTEILEEVTDGKLKLSDNPSQITDFGTEAVLKDTFAILCSPDIKLSTSRENEGDDADPDEAGDAGDGPSVASQLAAAKGKLLSKMSKKNFLENIVPVLIGLKHKLESKRSPLMRYLLHYIRELFKLYGQEVRDILSADPQMAMEPT